MTDDNSPHNLRKFLESDDPATVMMGLEMAKGFGIDEDLLPLVLGLALGQEFVFETGRWDELKTHYLFKKSKTSEK